MALYSNTTGGDNVAIGVNALFSNATGSANSNVAVGTNALRSNRTGDNNVADGAFALLSNTAGIWNTAIGSKALISNTTGSNNVAVGLRAVANLTTGDNNIDIGTAVSGVAGESNSIRIGKAGTQVNTFVAGISGTTVVGDPVVVAGNGHLGTIASSRRFKQEIKPMDKASEAIHALKPVTFRYKQEIDSTGRSQFGLVAEEVEKVNPDLITRDANGKPYSVRYEAVNAMLLNEFLKEHGKMQELEATVANQQKQIERLTSGLQKVSAQVEMSRPTPQVVANNQ